jgi:DNA-binding NarL/FixJ family response regulator
MTRDDRAAIRVLLAEDHTIVRQGLRSLLSREPDLTVVGEATDGREAVRLAEQLGPDVVIMDLAMPGLNGVDASRQIRKRCPRTRILILSMHQGEEYVRPAIRAGISGYLLKGSGISDLVAATRAVAAGEAFFSPAVSKILLRDARLADGDHPGEEERPRLSTREREILQLVAEGKSSPDIARLLHISVKTVEGHRGRIMQKLDIHDLAGLVRYAVRVGLVLAES